MGKSTISMASFNSYVTNYQRVPVAGTPRSCFGVPVLFKVWCCKGLQVRRHRQQSTAWWLTYPSEKWWTSSVGMMTFPIWWESHNPFHGSIIDLLYPIKMIERVNSINMIWNHLFHYVPLKTPWYPIKIPWFQSPTSQWMIEKTQPAEIGAVLWDSRLWLSEGAQMLANVDDASHMLLEHWHVQPDTQKQKHICIFPALFTSAQKSP